MTEQLLSTLILMNVWIFFLVNSEHGLIREQPTKKKRTMLYRRKSKKLRNYIESVEFVRVFCYCVSFLSFVVPCSLILLVLKEEYFVKGMADFLEPVISYVIAILPICLLVKSDYNYNKVSRVDLESLSGLSLKKTYNILTLSFFSSLLIFLLSKFFIGDIRLVLILFSSSLGLLSILLTAMNVYIGNNADTIVHKCMIRNMKHLEFHKNNGYDLSAFRPFASEGMRYLLDKLYVATRKNNFFYKRVILKQEIMELESTQDIFRDTKKEAILMLFIIVFVFVISPFAFFYSLVLLQIIPIFNIVLLLIVLLPLACANIIQILKKRRKLFSEFARIVVGETFVVLYYMKNGVEYKKYQKYYHSFLYPDAEVICILKSISILVNDIEFSELEYFIKSVFPKEVDFYMDYPLVKEMIRRNFSKKESNSLFVK